MVTETPERSTTVFAETFPKIPALMRHPVRCGKPNCRCARGEVHDSWRLVWRGPDGRQCHRYVRRGDLPAVQGIIARRRAERRQTRLAMVRSVCQLQRLMRLCREL